MAEHILQCISCHTYTLKGQCSRCGAMMISPQPPKFSLQDKYVQYRRSSKKEELKQKGLY